MTILIIVILINTCIRITNNVTCGGEHIDVECRSIVTSRSHIKPVSVLINNLTLNISYYKLKKKKYSKNKSTLFVCLFKLFICLFKLKICCLY